MASEQGDYRALTVLCYVFRIPYHDGIALPFVAAGSQKHDEKVCFWPSNFSGVGI